MSTPVTILGHGTTAAETGAAGVLASLPLSFAASDAVEGSVVVLDGSAGWTGRAAEALESGAAAVVVVHPELADVEDLRERGGLVVLDSRWSSNPVVPQAAEAFRDALPRGGRLECSTLAGSGTSSEHALLEQLSLVRRLVGRIDSVRVLSSSVHGYAAEAVAGGRPVDLDLVCSDAVQERVEVRLLTDDGSVELTIPEPCTAQPARLAATGPEGTRTLPSLWESGHRATWRRTHALLESEQRVDELAELAEDMHTVRTALQIDGGQAPDHLATSTLNEEPAGTSRRRSTT